MISDNYAFSWLWASLLLLLSTGLPGSFREKCILAAAWIAKVLVCLVVMLPYESYYGATGLDALSYFWIGRSFVPELASPHSYYSTELIYTLSWAHDRLLVSGYSTLKLSFAWIGLLGLFGMYRAVSLHLGRPHPGSLILLCFFPSLLFWSSIVGKEPLILLAISWFAYGTIRWNRYRSTSGIVLIALGLALSAIIRPWTTLVLAASLPLLSIPTARTQISRFLFLGASCLVAALAWLVFTSLFEIESASDLTYQADLMTRNFSSGGDSAREVNVDFGSSISVGLFLPFGMFSALFRPLPGEVLNPQGTLAGLENLVLVLLLVLAIARSRFRELWDPILLWCLGLVVFWSVLYAFVSSGNLGTAVRYRLQIFPFLLLLLCYFSRKRLPRTGVSPLTSRPVPASVSAFPGGRTLQRPTPGSPI